MVSSGVVRFGLVMRGVVRRGRVRSGKVTTLREFNPVGWGKAGYGMVRSDWVR